eukprot:3941930-Rhodomonas_salina.25
MAERARRQKAYPTVVLIEPCRSTQPTSVPDIAWDRVRCLCGAVERTAATDGQDKLGLDEDKQWDSSIRYASAGHGIAPARTRWPRSLPPPSCRPGSSTAVSVPDIAWPWRG